MSRAAREQLLSLLARGRALQWENTSVLVARVKKRRPGLRPSPLVELVYAAVQVIFAFLFIEHMRYVEDADYDAFTDALFVAIAGGNAVRLKGLVDAYASALPDEERMAGMIARDLAAALAGAPDPALERVLGGTSRALKKLTQVYVAMAFDDDATVKKLG